MHKILIIIPTYNESLNIKKIVDIIITIDEAYNILVVDDNSPDNTHGIVNKISQQNNRVHLIKRNSKSGIGTAYCTGFEYAIKNKYDKVVQIDADLSHNPKDIPMLIKHSMNFDLVIGSRYLNGISIINWPLSRLILSYTANLYARIFTNMKIKDCTGGFKCFNIDVLKKISFKNINSQGYSFQIEMNYLTYKNNFKIKEVPITFTDRTVGESKMSKKIIVEAIFLVPFLRFKNIFK